MGLDEGFLELARQLFGDEKARFRCASCRREHGAGLEAVANALRLGWPTCCGTPVALRTSSKRVISAAGRQLAARGASKGGKARAAALSVARRRDIARNAIATRWARAKGEIK